MTLGTDAETFQVLHERGARMLVRLLPDAPGESAAYGVVEDGRVLFRGTKAEAKKFYGNWRKL